ncbi:TetR/AcrR family transcriptional regulator [Vibrio cholerae]|uniref:TetR/AcrR family transcriptional regulator n=1 Tax=Vibrio cholerae TaxID=666 RepID=UPI0022F32D8C|nr:TetR/AcrR family transcriptional regulator [Vibrio cholerae]
MEEEMERLLSIRKFKKRTQILNAASSLFLKQGYTVSMDMIAKQAGVSKQTLYSHFCSKDKLFETCITEKCNHSGIDWELEADLRTPDEVLRDFCWHFHCMLVDEEVMITVKNAIKYSSSHPEIARIYLEQGPARTTNLLVSYIKQQIALGVFTKCDNPLYSATQILLMIHGRKVYWDFFGIDSGENERQQREYINSCVDLFLRDVGYIKLSK